MAAYKKSMRKIISFGAIAVFITVFLTMHFYPSIPRTLLGWVALFMLGLPAWFFLEWLGKTVLSSSFFKNRSRPVRIMLGVPALILLGGIAMYVISFINHSINYAGG